MLIPLDRDQIQLDNPPTEEACFKVDHTRRTHSVKYAHAVRNRTSKFCTVVNLGEIKVFRSSAPPCPDLGTEIFDTILTRDLFAIANLLVNCYFVDL